MQTVLTFLAHLVLYPVLFVGLVGSAARLYTHLLDSPCLGLAVPCKARWATAIVALIEVLLLCLGTPSFDNLGGIIVLIVWAAVLGAGACIIYQDREKIAAWLLAGFGCGCDCGDSTTTPPPPPSSETGTGPGSGSAS